MPAAKPKADAGRIRDDIVALFKPDAWMKKAEIAEALGVSSDFLTFHLGKLIADKELIATGSTGNRAFALPDTTAPKAVTKPAKAVTKPAKAKKTNKKVLVGKLRPATADVKATVHVRGGHIAATIEDLVARRAMIDAAITALQSL